MAVDEVGTGADTLDKQSLNGQLDVVEENLGRESRDVMEVLLSAHATHFLDGPKAGLGIMLVGPSGCGKTTLLRSFYRLDEQIYRSDDLTPASFVSHDASRTDEELEDIDLLPRLNNKTLVSPDMANWFSGPEEQIRERWSVFARVIDGDGYTRDSGAHGNRGYDAEIRFNFLGATTPLDPRAHRVMGHVGNRLLFVQMGTDEKTDEESAAEALIGDSYSKKVDEVNNATRFYLGNLWDEYGGPRSVTWENDPSEAVRLGLTHLAKLVRYARAPLEGGEPIREDIKRPVIMLRDLARGHALLEGRQTVQMEDLAVSARVALDTMPDKRRGVVRALVSPETDTTIDTDTVTIYTGASLPTAIKRMKLVDDLGLGTYMDPGSNKPKKLICRDDFKWPANLPWPER